MDISFAGDVIQRTTCTAWLCVTHGFVHSLSPPLGDEIGKQGKSLLCSQLHLQCHMAGAEKYLLSEWNGFTFLSPNVPIYKMIIACMHSYCKTESRVYERYHNFHLILKMETNRTKYTFVQCTLSKKDVFNATLREFVSEVCYQTRYRWLQVASRLPAVLGHCWG